MFFGASSIRGCISTADPLAYGSVDEDVVRIIEQQAQEFINDLIGKLRECMIDLRTGKAVFVGGGSILLRKYIESSDKVGYAIFVDEVSANAKGYELLYRAYKARR